jgi:hypothetical protein
MTRDLRNEFGYRPCEGCGAEWCGNLFIDVHRHKISHPSRDSGGRCSAAILQRQMFRIRSLLRRAKRARPIAPGQLHRANCTGAIAPGHPHRTFAPDLLRRASRIGLPASPIRLTPFASRHSHHAIRITPFASCGSHRALCIAPFASRILRRAFCAGLRRKTVRDVLRVIRATTGELRRAPSLDRRRRRSCRPLPRRARRRREDSRPCAFGRTRRPSRP